MKYSIVLVDDNSHDLAYLTHLIGSIGPEWHVIKVFDNPLKALAYLKLHQPDLMLVGIEMKGMSGIRLLEELRPIVIPTIFLADTDKYALRAFDLAALDYLIKPVSKMRLAAALTKRAQINPHIHSQQIDLLRSSLLLAHTQKHLFGRVILNNQQNVEVIDFKDIIYCKAEGPYSSFFLTDGKTKVAAKPLKYYETFLEYHDFFRLHRSYIVNLAQVKSIDKNSLTAVFVSGDTLPVTPDRLAGLIEKFKSVMDGYNL